MTRGTLSHRTIEIAAALWLATALWPAAAPSLSAQARLPRILVWDQSLRGTDEQELRWPVAVASASAEEIAVADAFEPRLLLFRKTGVSWRLENSVSLPGAPIALAYDGRRYVASLREGQGVVALEGPRLLQRRLRLPQGVVPGPIAGRSDGGLLLYDYAGERALELTADGDLAREVKIDGRVTALATAPAGGFYAAVGQKAVVLHYDAQGELDAVWPVSGDGPAPAWPSALVVEPAGDVAVVDRHGGRVLVFDVGGRPVGMGSRRGWEPGLLLFPRAIARLGDGRLVVADEGNGRAQIFRRTDRDAVP